MNKNLRTKGQEILQKNFPYKTRKLIPVVPTVLIGVIVIVLTVIPNGQTVKLQLQSNQFVFLTNFKPEVTFSPIKELSVEHINILSFKSVKIGYKKLFLIKDDGSKLLAQNGSVEIIPQLADYELKFFYGNITIGSLEIGGEALISITLDDGAQRNKLILEIRQFPSVLRLQLGDPVSVTTKRCIINYSDGNKIEHIQQPDHQSFIINPVDVSAISPVSGADNVLKLEFEIKRDIFTSIYESEMSFKMVGFSESDVLHAPDKILKARCKLLQIDDSQKEAYHDQNVFFRQRDLNQLKLEDLNLLPDELGKINLSLNFSGYTNNFKVGLQENRLRNIIPSILECLSKSRWAIAVAILAWIITSSLLGFDILYRRRTKEEK
ncbi:hypothetical protein JW960_12830 [candidate division KSB1 bacterium]|nr:hypothetical protein [candidate division KSB1 bacterium]